MPKGPAVMRVIASCVATTWTLGASVVTGAVMAQGGDKPITESTAISVGLILTIIAATWFIAQKFAKYDLRLREGQEMFKEIRETLKKLSCMRGRPCPPGTIVDPDAPFDKD